MYSQIYIEKKTSYMGAMMWKTLPAELERVDTSQEFNFLIVSEEEANLRSNTSSPSFFPMGKLVGFSEITAGGVTTQSAH